MPRRSCRERRDRTVECPGRCLPPPRRPEVRRLVRRRRRPHQAGRAPDRPRARGRQRPRRRRVGDGRHDGRAARPGRRDHRRPGPARARRPARDRRAPERDARCRWRSTRSACAAISLTGPQAGITTDGRYGRARIAGIEPRRVRAELDGRQGRHRGRVPGPERDAAADDDEITTLGRGGSDTTAVALAASLGAGRCQIFTDVRGIYTADPRLVAGRPPAAGHRLRGDARARPPGRPGHAGPGGRARLGQRRRHRGPELVRGRARARSSRRIRSWSSATRSAGSPTTGTSPRSRSSPCRTGRASPARSSTRWPRPAINVDMIVQNVGHGGATDLSFTVPRVELAAAKKTLDPVVRELGRPRADDRRVGRQGLDRRRRPAQRAGLRRADVRDAGRRRGEHRDDLDVRGPDHVHDRRGRSRDRAARAARRLRARAPRGGRRRRRGRPRRAADGRRDERRSSPAASGSTRVGSTNDVVRDWLAGGHARGLPRRRRRADRGPRPRGPDLGRRRRRRAAAVARVPAGLARARTRPGGWPRSSSLAMAEAAEAAAGLPAGTIRLKWPNDLVVEDRRRRRASASSPACSARPTASARADPRAVVGIGDQRGLGRRRLPAGPGRAR